MPPAAATHLFQAPKGTRDFYPAQMAVRRYIETVWREVSISHGFDEVDGPTFEHLDLYTVKSGPGIVSELFSFRRAGGETDYALRPEFTPTLARMVAARAGELPRPIRWFSMPAMFRAERPQRGRLREHIQWNADIMGDDSPAADAELLALAAHVLERFGLRPDQVQIRLSHRGLVTDLLRRHGVKDQRLDEAFALLDRRDKVEPEAFADAARGVGIDDKGLALFRRTQPVPLSSLTAQRNMAARGGSSREAVAYFAAIEPLLQQVSDLGISEWCSFDLGIVRGLAYYTGTVFEIHENAGRERAIAGGGRYDQLVEIFGGPSTPAVGFAMGDVVIRLVLEEHKLLEEPEGYLPRPDLFVISAGSERAEQTMRPLIARLRRAGLHVRHSDRATRNIGKLLGEAAKCRARQAVILGRELEDGEVVVKDLDSGEQRMVKVEALVQQVGEGQSAGGV